MSRKNIVFPDCPTNIFQLAETLAEITDWDYEEIFSKLYLLKGELIAEINWAIDVFGEINNGKEKLRGIIILWGGDLKIGGYRYSALIDIHCKNRFPNDILIFNNDVDGAKNWIKGNL